MNRTSNDNNGMYDREQKEQMKYHLGSLVRHTTNGIGYSPVHLSNIAQTFATIVKSVSAKGGNRRSRSTTDQHAILNHLFVQRSAPFWDALRERTCADMDSFRPKWLVSVAWSLATDRKSVV